MLGIEHSNVDEKVFNSISKVRNPVSGLLATDEFDITIWAIKILTEFMDEAEQDNDLVLKLESEIKNLKGEELHKVMRYMVYLLLRRISTQLQKMSKPL